MFISKLYGAIDDLYERYRVMVHLAPTKRESEAIRILDDSLYFASQLVEQIEQLKTELNQNNQ